MRCIKLTLFLFLSSRIPPFFFFTLWPCIQNLPLPRYSVRPFDRKSASCAFWLSKGSGSFCENCLLCVLWPFARNWFRLFDRKSASCALCVSKGSSYFSEIIILCAVWHLARILLRPFDRKSASCAICVSKGSGCFSGICSHCSQIGRAHV